MEYWNNVLVYLFQLYAGMRVLQEIPDFRKFLSRNSTNSLIFVQFSGNFIKFQEFSAISGIFVTVHSHAW